MPYSAQDKLFRLIKNQLPGEDSLADTISEILHVSTDSAYRRIRGETPLIIDEVMELCRVYNLSLDHLLGEKQENVSFRNIRVNSSDNDYAGYLKGLQQQLSMLESFEKKEIIYMSKDLPIFHNFYFRPLLTFRYYFWMKIIIDHPLFEHRLFETEMLPPAIENLSRDLVATYARIPSTEMWNIESINSTISQIEFARTSGHFMYDEDVIRVYDALEETVLHVREQADQGSKFLPGEDPQLLSENLKFFFNRVVLGDNTIMAVTDKGRMAYINYGNLNYLVTRDENFCGSLFEDFENLIRRSTLISVTGERQRNVFFNILLSKIKERKQSL
jgi:hypothetical protein